MAPPITVTDIQPPIPPSALTPLQARLPATLTLLRRLQFTRFPQDDNRHAHYLVARDDSSSSSSSSSSPFAAAYVDLSKGPETEMYLYTPLQDSSSSAARDRDCDADAVVERILDLAVALLARAKALAAAAASFALFRPHGVMVGGLHERTYRLLLERRGLRSSYWNPHDVWLFRAERLPAPGDMRLFKLPAGLRWDVVRREDCGLVASRTGIPKVAATLMSEPSVAVRKCGGGGGGGGGEGDEGDGVLVAWGFMGTAGTLSTLHVEEPYRGKGIAKAVATKVLREHSFGDDGWSSADVHVDNTQSQGVCKSLGGEKSIRTCWTVIDYDSIP